MKRGVFLAVLALSMLPIFSTGIATALDRPLLLSQANPKQSSARSFTGTVVKSGDLFKLDDKENKVSYTLDDTQRASQFDGKKVKVTGTLDSKSSMIHVELIEIAS